jgi:hypothetical protein
VYTPDASSALLYASVSATAAVTVTPPPSFSITGTSVSLKAGAATGNTSTVTVTPSGGFTGSVALTAAVASSPAGALFPPTLSFGSTGSVNITGASAGTATLTITTTAPSSPGCTNDSGQHQQASGRTLAGPIAGLAIAGLLFFGIPARRRSWRGMLSIFLLLAAFAAGLVACGGSGGGHACPNVISPGTTTGNYTITVTGTSGSVSSAGTITLTVQ